MIARGVSRWMAFAAAAAYLVTPGPSDTFFRGVPLGLGPFVALAIGVFVWVFFRSAPEPPRGWTLLTAALVALCAVKAVAAVAAPPVGWVGRYYANGSFAAPYRMSTEFTSLDATRIDREIDFRDDRLPVYFLNEADFNRDIRREVTMPVSVVWDGYVQPASVTPVPLALTVRGTATLSIDDRDVMRLVSGNAPAAESVVVALDPGAHRMQLRYFKPAGVDPLIQLQHLDEHAGGAALLVTPHPIGATRRGLFSGIVRTALVADAVAGFVFLAMIGSLAGVRRRASEVRHWWRADAARPLGAAMFLLLLIQGVIAAAPHMHRAVSLSGGDDWLAFEARAREVVTGGLLMRFGRALGAGEVFYYYPGYSYFLAAVHRVTGEDLSGPILANFLLLFLGNVVVYRLARVLFNTSVAVGATAALVLIEQSSFVRHYTPALLSENVYVFTVPLTMLGLVRYLQDGRRAPLVWAGVAAGVSAVTRPAMMMFLIPAVLIVIAAGPSKFRQRVASASAFVAGWFAVVLLITFRNYLVTGVPTLISESPTHSFIIYNLPPTADASHYMRMYSGGFVSAASVLLRVVIENPMASLSGVFTKVGFTFGMIQWMGGHAHPELVIASVLYFAALASCRAARARVTWPIHAFVAVHLAGMVLTMPSNYGYRLILPIYMFLPMFGASFVSEAVHGVRRSLGSDRTTVAPAGRPS